MNCTLCPMESSDLLRVHRLNQSALPHVNSLELLMLSWLGLESVYFRVAHHSDNIVGFVIALRPDSSYRSPNYRWFNERFRDFIYVDRIVVAENCHGQGIGQALYADLSDYATAVQASLIACEINLRPANQGSMNFHHRQGFIAVGSQDTEGGAKTVCLMARPLSSAGETLLAGRCQ